MSQMSFEGLFDWTAGKNMQPKDVSIGKCATIQEKFEAFHVANPQVYTSLVELARKLTAKGRTHFGIAVLWETLRYHYLLQTDDPNSEWKLNNNYRSRYARLIAQKELDLADIFELRELRSE